MISELHRRHCAAQFRKLLISLGKDVPAGLDLRLICENPATHKPPGTRAWLGHLRFPVRSAPAGSSWASQASRWSGCLTGQMKTVQSLEAGVRGWINSWTRTPAIQADQGADEIPDSPADI